MRKLRNIKQIGCCTGQKLSGTDLVVKAERQRLNMRKDISTHIRFDAHAKKMSPIVDDIKHCSPKEICRKKRNHQHDKQRYKLRNRSGLFKLRKQLLHDEIREQGECDVDCGNE